MLFTSGEFLFVYLPVTVIGFFLIARYWGHASAAAWLVLASFFFYAYWLPIYTLLLAVSIAFNYSFGLLIARSERPPQRKMLLYLSVGINLAVLGYFKYANF